MLGDQIIGPNRPRMIKSGPTWPKAAQNGPDPKIHIVSNGPIYVIWSEVAGTIHI